MTEARDSAAGERPGHAGAAPTPAGAAAPHDEAHGRSLGNAHRSVVIPHGASWFRRMLAFAGPAYLVSVGYMDPGNWATDLQGGARFGYQLVWVLLLSNLLAVLLQTLAARLGVVTGKDLAQACRAWYPRPLVWPLWIACEIAIVACDLAEVLGAAIGLHLLFGLSLLGGVVLTAVDVLLLLGFSRLGMRRMEAFIVALVMTIGGCFAYEMIVSRPEVAELLRHFVPRDGAGRVSLSLWSASGSGGSSILGLDHAALYVAIGILGATVMPHNLYLHSALVQTRAVEGSDHGKRQAVAMNFVDSLVALNAAFFVNVSILVLAAAVFHARGHAEVARLDEAHRLLTPLLGSLASTLFAVALLCSGQSSTITGTLAGQIVMEGFLRIRIRPWLRRLLSRGLAIVPAAAVIIVRGDSAVDALLVLSQVVLSLQLSFAVIPLVAFTSDRTKMGRFANSSGVTLLAVLAAALILGLNGALVAQQLGEWWHGAGTRAPWLVAALAVPALVFGGTLVAIVVAPLGRRLWPRLAHARPAEPPGPQAVGSGPRPAPFLLRHDADRPVTAPEALAIGRYSRVAVALEMGGGDRPVLDLLRDLPAGGPTEIVLLHVVESAAGRYLGADSSDLETRDDLGALEAIADVLRRGGVRASVALGHGDPAAELARLVEEARADLLVVGSHGHRMIGDLFFGSTTSQLRHRIAAPMLIVPAAER